MRWGGGDGWGRWQCDGGDRERGVPGGVDTQGAPLRRCTQTAHTRAHLERVPYLGARMCACARTPRVGTPRVGTMYEAYRCCVRACMCSCRMLIAGCRSLSPSLSLSSSLPLSLSRPLSVALSPSLSVYRSLSSLPRALALSSSLYLSLSLSLSLALWLSVLLHLSLSLSLSLSLYEHMGAPSGIGDLPTDEQYKYKYI